MYDIVSHFWCLLQIIQSSFQLAYESVIFILFEFEHVRLHYIDVFVKQFIEKCDDNVHVTNLQFSNDADRHKRFIWDEFYNWDKDFVKFNFVTLLEVMCHSSDFVA